MQPVSVLFPYLPIPAHRKRDRSRARLAAIFASIIQSRKASGEPPEQDMLQSFIDSRLLFGGSFFFFFIFMWLKNLVYNVRWDLWFWKFEAYCQFISCEHLSWLKSNAQVFIILQTTSHIFVVFVTKLLLLFTTLCKSDSTCIVFSEFSLSSCTWLLLLPTKIL